MTWPDFKRLLALTLALVIIFPLSLLAARWQWDRHHERSARNNLIHTNDNTVAVPAEQVLRAGVALEPQLEWRHVTITGTYTASGQRLWRKQTLDSEPGFLVMTPLVTANGLTVLVARGWVQSVGLQPAVGVDISVPSGRVTIEGRLRILPIGEADPKDIPAGQTNAASTMLTATTAIAYVEQTLPNPAPLTPIPLDDPGPGPHLGYVGQWLFIAGLSIVAYVSGIRSLRAELRSRQSAN